MQKKSIIKLSAFALTVIAVALLFIASCKKEEQTVTPAPPGNEFLTTVILTCVNANGSDTQIATWRDLTPDDTNPPDTSLAVLNLKKGAVYHVTIGILDETKNPAGDIAADILARGNYHLFCFYNSASLGSNLTVTRTDLDTNNPPLPIGLKDDFTTTTNTSNGFLEVVLRHQPNAKNGTCDPGSTDLDVNFQIHIN